MTQALLLAASLAAAASPQADGFRLIHVQEFAALRAKPAAQLHLYDANHDGFRKKNGVIPGAVLLTGSSDYDVARTLPADKRAKLVFYCASRL